MLLQKIKLASCELALQSKTYGLYNLLKSKRLFHQVLWVLFMLSSSSACCYYVFDAIDSFLSFKVVTVIRSELEQPAQFPSISFCSYSNRYFDNKNLSSILKGSNFNYDEIIQKYPEKYYDSFSSYLGLCYRFNSGKNLLNTSMSFFKSTIGGLDDSYAFTITSPGGLVLWIHNYNDPPLVVKYNMHHGNRVFASSGFYTQVIIDKIVENQLDYPYNKCYNDVKNFSENKTIVEFILNNNELYTQVRCFELCFELYYIQNNNCSCNNVTLGNVWQTCWSILEKENQSSCTWNYKQYFFSENLVENCSKYCPIKCNNIKYALEVSSIYENTSYVRFKAFYRSLSFTTISQEPSRRPIDLASNIGGLFGLFVGLSFISIIELTELFTEILFIVTEHVFNLKNINIFERSL